MVIPLIGNLVDDQIDRKVSCNQNRFHVTYFRQKIFQHPKIWRSNSSSPPK